MTGPVPGYFGADEHRLHVVHTAEIVPMKTEFGDSMIVPLIAVNNETRGVGIGYEIRDSGLIAFRPIPKRGENVKPRLMQTMRALRLVPPLDHIEPGFMLDCLATASTSTDAHMHIRPEFIDALGGKMEYWKRRGEAFVHMPEEEDLVRVIHNLKEEDLGFDADEVLFTYGLAEDRPGRDLSAEIRLVKPEWNPEGRNPVERR